jgi:hypothetical protein
MTIDISDNDPRVSYTANANGAQTAFAVPFEFFENADLNVYVADVLKTIGTGSANYGVSGGAGSTGTVTFVSGVTASATVVITRSISIERTTDFTAGSDINRAALNTQLDILTAISADLKDTAARALQLTDSDAAASLVLPAVADRKGKVLAFHATTGAVEAGPSTSAVQSVADNAAAVNLIGTADAISDINDLATTTNINNISSVAGIASNVSTVAGIASNVTAVAGDATDIGAVAGKAAEIGRLGTTEAVADLALLGTSTVVANIATVAGVASTMSAAASNATAAANSATASANSAAAAATALDSFDDRYLGSKSSEPSVDNDGNALVSGALYFNSTSNGMKVYDGSSWINASSAGAVSLLDYEYTATAGQTTFSGSDNNSATLAYAAGNLIVTLNGIVLDNGSDYTATSGTSIVLASGAALNDHLAVVAFKSFTVADTVAASTGGTFAGNVAVTGTISTTGKVALPATLGSAGQVLTVNSGASAAAWASPAGSLASLSDTTVSASDPTLSTNPASGLGHMWINTTTGFLYVLRDATAGANIWTNVGLGQTSIEPLTIVTATGGTVTTDGDYKVHTFTSSGTFVVTNTTGTLEPITYLMVGGGGAGGPTAATDYVQGGGGGAGGLLTSTKTLSLNASYPIVIGAGGVCNNSAWNDTTSGSDTTFAGLTALGGGRGGSGYYGSGTDVRAHDGGSGGGQGIWGEGVQSGSANVSSRVGLGTTGQGNNGGSSLNGITGSIRYPVAAGGGGGAGGVGQDAANTSTGGAGGVGVQSSISGTATYYAGGGGGGGSSTSGAGGNGGASINAAGAANTGAGGGGTYGNRQGGSSGGSGIVIIRYKFQ